MQCLKCEGVRGELQNSAVTAQLILALNLKGLAVAGM